MTDPYRITEQASPYRHLEKMPVIDILRLMNNEDKKVAMAVEQCIGVIEALVKAIVDKMLAGGRLFYIGAGTSGRLGVLDASECPPTFGIDPGLVIGVIAGGQKALVQAVEFAEDSPTAGWDDLNRLNVNPSDVVIGLAASGSTPYVVGALQKCKQYNITTGVITCNFNPMLPGIANFLIEAIVGPEFITGSTRLKAGTAQKMILNMISTSVMIGLGRVEDNQMVNMQLINAKLIDRGIRMVMEKLKIDDYEQAKYLLLQNGSVKNTLAAQNSFNSI